MPITRSLLHILFRRPRILVFFHDATMAAAAFMLAFYLRLGDAVFLGPDRNFWLALGLFTATCVVSFRAFGMNSGIWRYASMRDLTAILRAVSVSVLVSVLLMFFITRLESLPRSIPIISWFILVTFLGAPRLAYRTLKDRTLLKALRPSKPDGEPVLLLGAGDGAELFIRAMMQTRHPKYRVIGVIDEKGSRVGREIHGVRILGNLDELESIIDRLAQRGDRPQRLIVTKEQNRLDRDLVKHLIEKAESLNLTLARLPNLTQLHDSIAERPSLQPIDIADLLGRPQANLDRRAIGDLIRDRTVLVTGAGGSIGSELVRQIAAQKPRRLVLIENNEFNLYSIDREMHERFPNVDCRSVLCDVRDRARVFQLFREEQPALVFHAAALKHVPMVELNPGEGVLTNAIGTRHVADAASAANVMAMVLISTDKAVNPTNVMGASKRVAESYCQALDLLPPSLDGEAGTRFVTVRFGNVLGSTGSVVPLFQRQLQAGGPLTVTHPEIKRYFMTIREAVELVLQASAYGVNRREERGKIFVLDMGEPTRIVDLARRMIRLAGLRPDEDIRIEFTGLRLGEKLYEELFDRAEPPVPTEAEGVMAAAPRAVDFAILRRSLEELEAAAEANDEARMLNLIQHIVPEFHHERHPRPLNVAGSTASA